MSTQMNLSEQKLSLYARFLESIYESNGAVQLPLKAFAGTVAGNGLLCLVSYWLYKSSYKRQISQ